MQYTIERDDQCSSYIKLTLPSGGSIKSVDIHDIWEYLTMTLNPGDTVTIGKRL